MHVHPLPLPFAAIFDFDFPPYVIAIVIPIASLVLGGAIAITAMYFSNRRRQMWHETARLALEKGQPLPALMADDQAVGACRRDRSPREDVRAGLILVATGAALFLFLGNFLGDWLGYVGAIPGFIGLALLLFGLVNLIFSKKSDAHSPQA